MPVKNDKRLVRNVFQPHPSAFGQAVGLRQNHHEPLLIEQLAVQVDLLDRGTQKSYVDFLLAQRIILEARENVATFDFDRWPAFAMFENDFADGSPEP